MEFFKPLNVVEQLAAHLKLAISKGELTGYMPGIRSLATSLGVSPNSVTAALVQLENEGYLKPQGHGRRSLIVLPDDFVHPAFRVTLLPYERADVQLDYVVEIQQRLREAGHDVHVAEKSLMDMRLNVSQISKLVNKTKTDAWIVFSSNREILEWFSNQSTPVFALFGRFRRLPIAGIGLDKSPAFRSAIRRLVELGHQRIVLLQPTHNRVPFHALLVRESLAEMEANGIKTGPYNIPDWEQSPLGLRKRLDALFAVSPPTAIILDRPNELIATQWYLAQRGIFAPRDISLISDDDPTFEWYETPVCCIQWQSKPWVNRVVNWVSNVSQGKDDKRQSFTKAKFVERGSIGPVPNSK